MSFLAIVGAGAIGAALAHRLAFRDRVAHVRLVDSSGTIAQGKALDILQSSPIERFTARISSSTALEAVAGAAAIVVADAAAGDGEHAGENGLALIRRIAALEGNAPLLFAGSSQRELMMRTIAELRVDRRRVIGSAPLALESAVKAITALEVNGTGAQVELVVVGVPPGRAVIGWEAATVHGAPAAAVIPAYRLAGISARVPGLWPPGPFALASAASRTVEAIANGSRRRFTCFAATDGPEGRHLVIATPVELGPAGIVRVVRPTLSRQEQTLFENAFGAR